MKFQVLQVLVLFISFSTASYSQNANDAQIGLSIENSLKDLDIDLGSLEGLVLINNAPDSLVEFKDTWINEQANISSLLDEQYGLLQVVPGSYAEYEFANINDDVTRELMLSIFAQLSEQDSECDAAAVEWDEILRYYSAKVKSGNLELLIKAIESSGKKNDFIRLVNDYKSACLSDFNTIPTNLVDAGIRNVVAFVIVDDYPQCGALRLENNLFITARHCFFNEVSGHQYLTKDNAHLSILDSYTEKIVIEKITPVHDNQNSTVEPIPFGISNDFVYLHTESVLSDMPVLSLGFGETGEQVIVPGYYRFFDPDSLFDPPIGKLQNSAWTEGIKWSNSRQCVIGEVVNNCRVHYCQSDAHYSGSPVFKRSLTDGKLTIAGLHVASMGSNTNCNFDWSEQAGNIAIGFPSI